MENVGEARLPCDMNGASQDAASGSTWHTELQELPRDAET
jgi:hypothetical protein